MIVCVHRSLVAQGRFGLKSTVRRMFATKTVAFGAPPRSVSEGPPETQSRATWAPGGVPNATVYKESYFLYFIFRKYKYKYKEVYVYRCPSRNFP